MIAVTDKLGHEWRLYPISSGRLGFGRRPLTEMWMFCAGSTPESLARYQRIPVPVFTAWWTHA